MTIKMWNAANNLCLLLTRLLFQMSAVPLTARAVLAPSQEAISRNVLRKRQLPLTCFIWAGNEVFVVFRLTNFQSKLL